MTQPIIRYFFYNVSFVGLCYSLLSSNCFDKYYDTHVRRPRARGDNLELTNIYFTILTDPMNVYNCVQMSSLLTSVCMCVHVYG